MARRYRSRGSGRFVISAVAAGIGLATLTGHHAATGGATAITDRAVIPGGSAYTPTSWAVALLTSGGWPRTSCNIGAITACENAEGGNWANSARFNPLDTTEPEPGSYPMNSAGVQAYTSWAEGFRATLTTLANGNYGAILAALASGDSAQAVAGTDAMPARRAGKDI